MSKSEVREPHQPKSRPADFGSIAASGVRVKQPEQGKRYVLVSPSNIQRTQYEQEGYQLVVRRPGGPYIFESTKMGDPVTYMDQLLHEIDAEDYRRIEMEGSAVSGALGQNHFRELEKRVKSLGGLDVPRGPGQLGPGMSVTSETTGLAREG